MTNTMAQLHLMTIGLTILLVFIHQGGTQDPPKKPANGIEKPGIDKPAKPPVLPPVTQAKTTSKARATTRARTTTHDIHGRVPMGTPNVNCDDGIVSIVFLCLSICLSVCMSVSQGSKDFDL